MYQNVIHVQVVRDCRKRPVSARIGSTIINDPFYSDCFALDDSTVKGFDLDLTAVQLDTNKSAYSFNSLNAINGKQCTIGDCVKFMLNQNVSVHFLLNARTCVEIICIKFCFFY